jgi:hypothetical protein
MRSTDVHALLVNSNPIDLLVNAIARGYYQIEVLPEQERSEHAIESPKDKQERFEKELPRLKPGVDKTNLEREIKAIKDGIKQWQGEHRTLPQLLELAEESKNQGTCL